RPRPKPGRRVIPAPARAGSRLACRANRPVTSVYAGHKRWEVVTGGIQASGGMGRRGGEGVAPEAVMEIGSFVALGDSFTEGLADPPPDQEGDPGWADRVSGMLAGQRPGLRYANLAVRGKLLGQVAEEQIPQAIAMAPDLVSLAAGGNDLLRPRGDPDTLAEQFDEAVRTLLMAGCRVLVFTAFRPPVPLPPPT